MRSAREKGGGPPATGVRVGSASTVVMGLSSRVGDQVSPMLTARTPPAHGADVPFACPDRAQAGRVPVSVANTMTLSS